MKLIETKSARFHRNGISGAGFVAVLQTYDMGDEFGDRIGRVTMLTTYFPKYDKREREVTPEYYSTICLEHPEMHWRGNYFVDEAWAAGRRARADRSLYAA
jgi:hypothetical protein